MNSSSSRKKNWKLTREAFDNLLARFDPDRERAGYKYEILRLKLLRFFEWRGCFYPEDHADETMNRVSRKLDEGETVDDITKYAYGVAKLLFLEILKAREKERVALESLPPQDQPEFDPQSQSKLKCFESCLGKLPDKDRDLIIRYYPEENSDKIANRKQLAEEQGIPLNALRIRTHRIRKQLEQCIGKCLEKMELVAEMK